MRNSFLGIVYFNKTPVNKWLHARLLVEQQVKTAKLKFTCVMAIVRCQAAKCLVFLGSDRGEYIIYNYGNRD